MSEIKKIIVLCLILFPLSVLAKASNSDIRPRTIKIIQAKGDRQFAPFEFINDRGEPDGFSVELFRALMKRAHLQYTLQLDDWSRVQRDLKNDSIDLAIGMVYSANRAKIYKFGIPHCMISYNIICRKGNDYKTIEELRGKSIIVQNQDRAHDYLLSTKLTDKIIAVKDIEATLATLASGKYDAILSYDMTSSYFLRRHHYDNLVVHQCDNIPPEGYSIVVNARNEELLYRLNATLYQMKVDGEYDRLYNKWFKIYGEQPAIGTAVWYILGALGLFLLISLAFTWLLRARVRQATKGLKNKQRETQKLLNDLRLEITKRKIAEEKLIAAKEHAEEGDRLKSAFLANMSHEIRTPLNAIVGFSELMQTSDNEEEKEEFSNIINRNNELLLSLISDILDLSKLESGMMDFHPETFDFAQIFEETYTSSKLRCTNPEVEIKKRNPYLRCIITLDRNRLVQVLTNFVTNAIKYTPKGYIVMGYEYINQGIKIYVEDTGIGISEEKQKSVFDRFVKLDDFAQGTGLGLCICKAIVDSQRGEIGVESHQNIGSTFWAWIPCEGETVAADKH